MEIKGKELTCVATLYRGVVYIIPPPAEHLDVINYIEYTLGEKLDGTQVNGFLTDKEEFVTIEEGLSLASKADKIRF